MIHQVVVQDLNGFQVLRYLRLPDQMFFGGTTGRPAWDGSELDYGPHVWHTRDAMLGLIARLANVEGHPYSMSASDQPWLLVLQPETLMADQVAAVLGLDVAEVIAYYGLAIRLTDA